MYTIHAPHNEHADRHERYSCAQRAINQTRRLLEENEYDLSFGYSRFQSVAFLVARCSRKMTVQKIDSVHACNDSIRTPWDNYCEIWEPPRNNCPKENEKSGRTFSTYWVCEQFISFLYFSDCRSGNTHSVDHAQIKSVCCSICFHVCAFFETNKVVIWYSAAICQSILYSAHTCPGCVYVYLCEKQAKNYK